MSLLVEKIIKILVADSSNSFLFLRKKVGLKIPFLFIWKKRSHMPNWSALVWSTWTEKQKTDFHQCAAG